MDEEEGVGAAAHRGTARSGRVAVTAGEPVEGDVGGAVYPGQDSTATATQLPPSGRKSLSPWGSYQVGLFTSDYACGSFSFSFFLLNAWHIKPERAASSREVGFDGFVFDFRVGADIEGSWC